jgi:signal transduction histidine kinase
MTFNHSIQRQVFLIFDGFTLMLSLFWLILAYSGLSILLAYVVEDEVEDEVLEKLLAQQVIAQQTQTAPLNLTAFESTDEIGFLARTIENSTRELKISIKRESDFNPDVSHKLRTPLTVLNNSLTLASK